MAKKPSSSWAPMEPDIYAYRRKNTANGVGVIHSSTLGVVGVERGRTPNRRRTPQTPPGQSTPRNRRIYAVFGRKTVSDSRFPPNRKQKYGGHPTNELAATDFLFDFGYIMGSISTLNGILYSALLPLAHYEGVRT